MTIGEADRPKMLVVSNEPVSDLVEQTVVLACDELGEDAVAVVLSAEAAKAVVAYSQVTAVLIDPALEQMNPFDLCGWIRARWRDLPATVIEDSPVDTEAVYLAPGGAIWTISESLRERMTDLSVLRGLPGEMPTPPPEWIAQKLGLTIDEVNRNIEEICVKAGMATYAEVVFHVANLPLDGSQGEVRFEPGPVAMA